MARDGSAWKKQPCRLFEPALGSIAGHRIADALGRGEAEPNLAHAVGLFSMRARSRLEDESRRHPATTGRGDREKLGSTFETDDFALDRRLLVRDGVASKIVWFALIARRTGAFAPWPVCGRGSGVRRRWPCVRESHGDACG